MNCEYKKLTPWQRYEAIIAFSESVEPPCDDKDFEKWAIQYHRERLNKERIVLPEAATQSKR